MFKNYWKPFFIFGLLLIHGSFLGLSDDEAYYWVLAQKPALGYAFHPPGVAWLIAGFQFGLGWIFGNHSAGLVRLPAALATGLILALAVFWLERVGLEKSKRDRGFWVLVSFYGFFSLSWMMVPDIPLFLSWTALFVFSWMICFNSKNYFNSNKKSLFFWNYFGLGLSACWVVLSKYSGILAVFSALLSVYLWAPSPRRNRAYLVLGCGLFLASLPIVIWNSGHEWASLLYQVRDRHSGGETSWSRYLRFWGIELLLCGPLLVGFGWVLIGRVFRFWSQSERVLQWVSVWTVPAALVFCIQPLFSDFKPHWAFIVGWPIALGLATVSQDDKKWRWIRFQVGYGLSMGALILVLCHVSLGHWLVQGNSGFSFDPRLDVTNDLYGWRDLAAFLDRELPGSSRALPVVGSRYQTASQLAFNLGEKNRVTFVPRDFKERDEWPDLGISDQWGPDWPVLKLPVLFMSDNRYDAGPEFKHAVCKRLRRFEALRSGRLAKWVDIWRCDPELSFSESLGG